ncbi:unnamed protein product [Cylindrotheca closterium]|uniref:Uncharacterized protein n=2 Tax=Eukaryota TaxID=2759 RepID=A0AAD2PY63_9STRA|nr:unnamed protein product [Cylindrotheca closterium]
MNTKSPRHQFMRKMSSISIDSADSCDSYSSNLEPNHGFCSAPASIEFPALAEKRLSLERFVADIIDPNDGRVSPMRAPERTRSDKLKKSFGKGSKGMHLGVPKKKKQGKKGKKEMKQNGSINSAPPAMPLRKASFIQ